MTKKSIELRKFIEDVASHAKDNKIESFDLLCVYSRKLSNKLSQKVIIAGRYNCISETIISEEKIGNHLLEVYSRLNSFFKNDSREQNDSVIQWSDFYFLSVPNHLSGSWESFSQEDRKKFPDIDHIGCLVRIPYEGLQNSIPNPSSTDKFLFYLRHSVKDIWALINVELDRTKNS